MTELRYTHSIICADELHMVHVNRCNKSFLYNYTF